eukprot:TRINITY_DN3476_c2_g1_i2.p1 TRINITY_DN3476_c2_g1~~TRINITY_DN3476_c2_g1_i2.p1  ORF type:complete len:2821 (+),score=710.18 TRINITY_DN3476_c2_g1_i2:67-8529(+)
MSLVAVNEILATNDQRKAAIEISKYVISLSEAGEVDTVREPGVWSAAVKYLVGKVLVGITTAKETVMKNQYSGPLRVIVVGLHAGCAKDSFDPPLSAGSVDLLYQHITSVLRSPSCKPAYTDYCATLTGLVRLGKYCTWMRPEVLEGLVEALTDAVKATSGAAVGNLSSTLSTILGAYPRVLPPAVATLCLEFAIEVLPHAPFSQHLVLNTLRSLNAVIKNVLKDALSQIKSCLCLLSPYLAKLIQPQGSMTEALRYEAVEVLKYHLEVCRLTTLERTHANDVPNLDELWVGLSHLVGLKSGGSLRAEATVFDERNNALVELLAEVACLVSERHHGAIDTQLTEPSDQPAKRRKKQHPWDTILAGVKSPHDLVSWMWLKVLSGYVVKQAVRDPPILSPEQLAEGIDCITAYLSRGSSGFDAIHVFALQTAAKLASLPPYYTSSPCAALQQSVVCLRDHLIARIAGSVPNQATPAVFEGLCAIFALPSSFSQCDEDAYDAHTLFTLPPYHSSACSNPSVRLLVILLQGNQLRPTSLSHLLSWLVRSSTTATDIDISGCGLALSLLTSIPLKDLSHPWLAPSQDTGHDTTSLLPALKKTVQEAVVEALNLDGVDRVVRGCKLLSLILTIKGMWDTDKAVLAKHCTHLLEMISVRWHRFEGKDSTQALRALQELLLHEDGKICDIKETEFVGKLGGIARKLLQRVEMYFSNNEGDGDAAMAEGSGDMLATPSVVPVRDSQMVLFTCTTAAIHVYGVVSVESGEPFLGSEVRQTVDRIWNVSKLGPLAFDVAEFLSVVNDSRNIVSCLTKLRELLACKQNKWDDECITRTLTITRRAVKSTPSLEEAGITDLLRDTIDKLTEVDSKCLLAPRSKIALCHTTMAIVPKAEGDLLGIALNSFLPLLSDPSHAVRIEAAGFVSTLVNLFEHPHGVFNSIVDKLAPHFAGKQTVDKSCNTMAQTSILAIAEIAKHSDTMQGTALLQLLLINTHKEFNERIYLEKLMKEVAKCAGACDTKELISWHIPFLLRGWVISKALPLKTFPYSMLGCQYYTDFLERYMCYVLPAVLQSDGRNNLVANISSVMSADETELLVKYLPDVFGQVYLNYYDPSVVKTAKAVCEDYVKGRLSDQRLSIVLEQNIYEILRVFISLESGREDCELPKVHSSVVDRAFADFAGLWGRKEQNATANFLASTPDCVYKLVLSVGVEILQKKRLTAWRQDRFKVLVKLLKRCSPRTLSMSHVFKLATHLCIVVASTIPNTLSEALDELYRLCRSTASCSPVVLARYLSDIVTRLMPFVTGPDSFEEDIAPSRATSPVLDDSESDELIEMPPKKQLCITLKTINKILECAEGSKDCRKALTQTVNPFPAKGKYTSCFRLYDKLSGGLDCGWSDYVRALKASNRSSVRCAVLQRLRCSVATDKDYFKEENSEELLSFLVDMCCTNDDKEVRLAAAEALAAMQTAGHHVSVLWSNTLQELPLPKEDDWDFFDFMRLGRLCVLQELVNSVCGSDHEAVLAASETLQLVLAVDFNDTTAIIQTAAAQLKDDLVPFCPSQKKIKGLKSKSEHIKTPTLDTLAPRINKTVQQLRDVVTWDPSKPFSQWISSITCGLLCSGVTDPFLEKCAGVCLLVPAIAHALLPYALVNFCLSERKKKVDVSEAADLQTSLAVLCDKVFSRAARYPQHSRVLLQAVVAIKAIQTDEVRRVGVADEKKSGGLRLTVKPGTQTVFLSKLNMQTAVDAALKCGAQVTALRLAEQCLERKRNGLVCLHQTWRWEDDERDTNDVLNQLMTMTSKRSMSQITKGRASKGCRPTKGYHNEKERLCAEDKTFRKLLVEIANTAGDTELLKGFDDGSEPTFRLCHYEREGDWLKALACCDGEYSGGDSAALTRVLRGNGMHGVLAWGLSSAHHLTQWGDVGETEGFPHYIKSCLSTLGANNLPAFTTSISDAKTSVAEELARGKQHLERCLARTKCIKLLEETWSAMWKETGERCKPPTNEAVHSMGLLQTTVQTPSALDLADVAMPYLLAPTLLATVGRGDLYHKAIEDAVKIMHNGGNINAALTLIHRTRQGGMLTLSPELNFAEAVLLRKRGENSAAVACLKKVTSHLKTTDKTNNRLLAATLCKLGKWMGTDKSETRSNVINNYLTPAAQLIGGEVCPERADVFYTLGRFLDKLYVTLSTREVSSSNKLMEEARDKYIECHKYLKDNKGKLSSVKERVIERTSHHFGVISSRATEEEDKLHTDQEMYLLQSVKAYCLTTLHSDSYDLICVFRLVALWLQNEDNSELNHYLTGFFGKLASSSKFVPLAYQLVSRLSGKKDTETFQATLTVLLEKLARNHPHHVLHHLSALSYGGYLPDQQRYREVFMADTGKIEAAKRILKALSRSKTMAPLLEEMRTLVEAYMQFAFHPINKKTHIDGEKIPLTKDLSLKNVRSLSHAVVPTYSIPVSKMGDYARVPRVKEFEPCFTTAGGINLPKIIRCLGSDGKWYKQLVKGGQDDLRQDAVLEQFFGLCNDLLRESNKINTKDIEMRTYKVIPLSPTSGIVQWVNDTVPMGEWLLRRSDPVQGAHRRYCPDDMTYKDARVALSNNSMTAKEKRASFAEVCNNFTPVLHHFFLENYPGAVEWFRARRAYTKSTAAASIIGYIVGLGDRHSQNILLDTNTGEVIHIDLGVAFEKGKFLPVPELVPFRLTRDVIDGMGITGIEGVFRSTSERTLSVLRDSKQLLQTITEVFIHDPLYNYSLDPSKMMHKQSEYSSAKKIGGKTPETDAGQKRNPDAELALMRVTEKLDGYEDGEYLSVAGQTNKLIKNASSLDTLAEMYVGWAAWM